MDQLRRHLPWVRRSAQSEFRQALRDRDVPLLMKASKVLFPKDQQPADETEATAQMHIARTMQGWMTVEERAYSHFWLKDRGFPSMLPNELLPWAERFEPAIRSGVGIACGTGKEWLKPALPLIQGAMAKTVIDRQELIETDPDLLRDKIKFAHNDEFRRLFGVPTAREVER